MPIKVIPSVAEVDLSPLEQDIATLQGSVSAIEQSVTANSNSINGINSALPGKSDTTHNHNLNDLTEKSYNSLTDKPTLFTKTITTHSYCVQGEIVVPSGQEGAIPLFYVPVLSGYSSKIISAKYVIGGGTSVTATLKKNGTAITAYTDISITTTPGTTTADETIANGDSLQLEVTAVSATPTNLTFSIFIETEVSSA